MRTDIVNYLHAERLYLDDEVVQHIEYVPFGEVFLEEKNAKWNTPLNAMQGSTGLPTAGGKKHFLSPGSIKGYKDGHSIYSVIESLETHSFGQFVKNTVDSFFKPISDK